MPPLTRLALKNKTNLPKASPEPEAKKRRVGRPRKSETAASEKSSSSFDVKRVINVLPAPESPFDFDKKKAKELESVANFAPDIFKYLKNQERRYQLHDYIPSSIMSARQRALVVDWLCECQENYSFTHETMYIAVKLFDTFMSKNPQTPLERVQLVAAAAFLIASKYEEYEPPRISELIDLCNDGFSRKDLIQTERMVLVAAHGDLGFPLSYSFLRRYARAICTSMKVLTTARFALEISLHFHDLGVKESPSKLAAASLVLGLSKVRPGSNEWVPHLEHYSGWSVDALDSLVKQLDSKILSFKRDFPRCKVVIDKYSDSNFHEVATQFYYKAPSG